MKATRIFLILFGVLMIVAGVYCLMYPEMTYMTLGYVIGITMIMDAVGNILMWGRRKALGFADGWTLAGAIVSLLCGILLTGSTALQLVVDMTAVYLAAIWLIVIGVIRVVYALRIRSARLAFGTQIFGRRWGLIFLFGLLLIVCGVFSLVNPNGLIVAIGLNFGLSILFAGANLLAFAL